MFNSVAKGRETSEWCAEKEDEQIVEEDTQEAGEQKAGTNTSEKLSVKKRGT